MPLNTSKPLFGRLPPLLFHDFHNGAEAAAAGSMTADELDLIINSIGRENILDAAVYAKHRADGTLLPHQTCITFDGGLRCQYEIALPVLRRYDIRAIWHVCVHNEGSPTYINEQVLNYFQEQCYPTIHEFYAAFFDAAVHAYGDRVQTAMMSADAITYASHVPFYSVSDRQFLFLRESVLEAHEFFGIVEQMMHTHEFLPAEHQGLFWMSDEHVRELVHMGHSVGLFIGDHSGPDFEAAEYAHRLAQLGAFSPFSWAQSSVPRRLDTRGTVLDELQIELGFLSFDDGSCEIGARPYAVPRVDSRIVLRTIQERCGIRLKGQVEASPGERLSQIALPCNQNTEMSANALPHEKLIDPNLPDQRADVVCARALAALGVHTCFGIPGVQNLALYRALAHVGGVQCVLIESELNAMAVALGNATCDLYALPGNTLSGSALPLACLNVIGGPGVTHALGGIALAARTNMPTLVVCTGVRSHPRRAFQLHDVDNGQILAPVCKAVFRVRQAENLVDTLAAAAHIARTAPYGPVAVELAADVLGVPLSPEVIGRHTTSTVLRRISQCHIHSKLCDALYCETKGAVCCKVIAPHTNATKFLSLLKCAIGTVDNGCTPLVVANDVDSFSDACEWAFGHLKVGLLNTPPRCKLWFAIPFAVGAALRLASKCAVDGEIGFARDLLHDCNLHGKTEESQAFPRAIALTCVAALDYTALAATVALNRADANIMVCVIDDYEDEHDQATEPDREVKELRGNTPANNGPNIDPKQYRAPMSQTEAAARATGAFYVDAIDKDPENILKALRTAAAHRGVVFVRVTIDIDSVKTVGPSRDMIDTRCSSPKEIQRTVVEHILANAGGTLFVGAATRHAHASVFDSPSDDDGRIVVCENDLGASFAALGASRVSEDTEDDAQTAILWLDGDDPHVQGMSGVGEAFMDNVPLICIIAQLEAPVGCVPVAARCCAPLCVNCFPGFSDYCVSSDDLPSRIDKRLMTFDGCECAPAGEFLHRFVAKDFAELGDALRKAKHMANTLRGGGPALIVLDRKIFEASDGQGVITHEAATPQRDVIGEISTKMLDGEMTISGAVDEALENALTALLGARRLIVYAGQGASRCTNLLEKLAKLTGCIVATTWSGKGALSERHPQWLWCAIGAALPPPLREVAADADAYLILGARLSEAATAHYRMKFPALTVHVDIDQSVLQAVVPLPHTVCADSAEFLGRLIAKLESKCDSNASTSQDISTWHVRLRNAHNVVALQLEEQCVGALPTPARLAVSLQRQVPKDTIFCTDSGNGTPLFAERLRVAKPRLFHCPSDYSSMGYSVPAAFGAAIASRRLAVALVGDGALMQSGGELRAAARARVPLLVIVLRDGELGLMATLQRAMGETEHCTVTLPYSVRGFSQLCGVEYYNVCESAQLDCTLATALDVAKSGSPAVVECEIDYSLHSFFTNGCLSTPPCMSVDMPPASQGTQLLNDGNKMCGPLIGSGRQASSTTPFDFPPVHTSGHGNQEYAPVNSHQIKYSDVSDTDEDKVDAPHTAVSADLLDLGLGSVARVANILEDELVENLITRSLNGDARILMLAKHFGTDVSRFCHHAKAIIRNTPCAAYKSSGCMELHQPREAVNSMAPQDVWKMLERANNLYGDCVAVRTLDVAHKTLTYSQLYEQCCSVARYLHDCAGVRGGTHIAVVLHNCLECIVVHFACAALRAVVVNVNTRLSSDEMTHVLQRAEVRCLVASLERFSLLDTVMQRCDSVKHVLWAPPPLSGQERAEGKNIHGFPISERVVHARYSDACTYSSNLRVPLDTAVDSYQMYFTSGTTGTPKAVVLSHRVVALHAVAACAEFGLSDLDVWGHFAPMYHVVDSFAIYAMTWVGGTHAVLESYAPHRILECIAALHVSVTNLGSTMLIQLAAIPELDDSSLCLDSVRLLSCGGSPVPEEVLIRSRRRFSKATIFCSYGMTECCGKISFSLPTRAIAKLNTADRQLLTTRTSGRPFLMMEVRIVDSSGNEVPMDSQTAGEVQIRGPTLFDGYWRDDAATKDAFTRDGWFRTGDVGIRHTHGYISIVDRQKDMLLVGGENVYSVEVEHVLMSASHISAAAVVARSDDVLGQCPVAFVELDVEHAHAQSDEAKAIISAARAHCTRLLADFKVPHAFFVCTPGTPTAMPRTSSGKIRKSELRSRLQITSSQSQINSNLIVQDSSNGHHGQRPSTYAVRWIECTSSYHVSKEEEKDDESEATCTDARLCKYESALVLQPVNQFLQNVGNLSLDGAKNVHHIAAPPSIVSLSRSGNDDGKMSLLHNGNDTNEIQEWLQASLTPHLKRGKSTLLVCAWPLDHGTAYCNYHALAHFLSGCPNFSGTLVFLTDTLVIENGTWASPRHAALVGLSRSLRAEFESSGMERCVRVIDLRGDVHHKLLERELTIIEHHGEVALRATGGLELRRYAAALTRVEVPRSKDAWRSDGTHLITGGTGALGAELARWLLDVCGVKEFVLFSRSASKHEALASELIAAGATRVQLHDGDISCASDVNAALEVCGESLRGVWHLAGVLDDGTCQTLSWARVSHVLAAKCEGARHLELALRDRSLDAFVLFGSLFSVLGFAQLTHYSAANLYLSSIAACRRAHTQRADAICVQWGAIANVGMAHELGNSWARYWQSIGMQFVDFKAGLNQVCDVLHDESDVEIGLYDCKWAEYNKTAHPSAQGVQWQLCETRSLQQPARAPAGIASSKGAACDVLDAIVQCVRDVLGIENTARDVIDADASFVQLGLSSIHAARFVAMVCERCSLSTQLSALVLLEHTTPRRLTSHVLSLQGSADLSDEIIPTSTTEQFRESTAPTLNTSAPCCAALTFPRKKRCLILHGEASNADIMRLQMQMTGWIDGVGSAVEFVFVDAPHRCRANTSLHSVMFQCGIYDANKTYFGWGLEPCDTYLSPGKCTSDMVLESIEYVRDCMQKYAPIDGIAGICDGGLLASYAAAHGQNGAWHQLSFLLNFCSPPLHRLPSDIVGDLSVIQCVNLHFLGQQDELYSQEDLLSIPRSSKNAIVCYHDGGHVIPMLNDAFRSQVIVSIEGIRPRMWSQMPDAGNASRQESPDPYLVLSRTRDLLRNPNIDLDSSLFAAGMTSLDYIQLTSLLSEICKREVSPAVVLEHSSLREILSAISAAHTPLAPSSEIRDTGNESRQESPESISRSVEAIVESSDFDTRVLGIPTSRAVDIATPKDLERVLELALSQGVHLLTLSLNAEHPLELVAEPYRVCSKVTFRSSTAEMLKVLHRVSLNRDSALQVREFASDGTISSEMIDLAVNTGMHSRFYRDPRLGRERMVTMFETWVRNSAKRVAADNMLVASVNEGHGEKVVGYITCKLKVGEGATFGDITLMACNPEYSHLGVTWHLLNSAIEWFKAQGIDHVEGTTHSTNTACLAMYETAGMQRLRTSHDYHIWVQLL